MKNKTKTIYLNQLQLAALKMIHSTALDLEKEIDRFYNKLAVEQGIDYSKLDWRFTEIRESFEAVWLTAPATWKELKEFLDTLTPEEMEKDSCILLDDNSHFTPLLQPARIEEDLYVNQDDPEDFGSLQDLKDAHGKDYNEADYRLITPKGKPYFWAESY